MKKIQYLIISMMSVMLALSCQHQDKDPLTELPRPQDSQSKLKISFNTTQPDGKYKQKNVMAVWIEDVTGNLIRAVDRWGRKRHKHLAHWYPAARNIPGAADAVTGATLKGYQRYTSEWDLRDQAGNLVVPGTYHIKLELTNDNKNKKKFHYTVVTVTIGDNFQRIGPFSQNGFENIIIEYVPE